VRRAKWRGGGLVAGFVEPQDRKALWMERGLVRRRGYRYPASGPTPPNLRAILKSLEQLQRYLSQALSRKEPQL
jgi:hypothetical protein